MTWREWMAARQLLAEEQLGKYARAGAQAEDSKFSQAARLAPRG